MLIQMMDVNFGEAFLLQQEDNGRQKQLLVDCGANFEEKGDVAAGAVRNLLKGEKKSALLTHFHEDHYNGFIQLAKKMDADMPVLFDTFYLPLYVYDEKEKKIIETSEILDATIKILCYHKIVRKGKKLHVLHEFFNSLPLLVSPKNVKCIGKGDRVECGSKKFDVVWPDREQRCWGKVKKYSAEIERMLSGYNSGADLLEHIQVVVNSYSRVFAIVYSAYAGLIELSTFDMSLESAYRRLNNDYDELDKIDCHIALNEKDKKRFNYIVSSTIKCMNDCSIVMHCGDELLMLGDIGKNALNRIDREVLNKSYKVVKVPHHGTKKYYSDKLPKAEKYLISNNGEKHTDWGICDKYPSFYSGKMVCTNTNPNRCAGNDGCPCNPSCHMSTAVGEDGKRVCGNQEVNLDTVNKMPLAQHRYYSSWQFTIPGFFHE